VSRGITLLFYRTSALDGVGGSQPHTPAASTPRKDPIPIVQETGWAPGPVWTGGKFRPHRDSIPDRPALSQSLYRLSYPAQGLGCNCFNFRYEAHSQTHPSHYALSTKLYSKCIQIHKLSLVPAFRNNKIKIKTYVIALL